MADVDPRAMYVARTIGRYLDQILTLFRPGMHVAIVVWRPGHTERDFVLHSPEASLQEVIATLQRRLDDDNNLTGRTSDNTREGD